MFSIVLEGSEMDAGPKAIDLFDYVGTDGFWYQTAERWLTEIMNASFLVAS